MMKRLLLAIALCVLASPALAAITFDVASSSEGTSSTSHDHTVAADANVMIVCVASRDEGGAVQAAASVTVEGAAATLLISQPNTTTNFVRTDLWYKLAPTTGAGVTIAATGDASTDFMSTGVMTFKDVAQTLTFNTAAAATGSSTNVDIASIASAVGELGVYCGVAQAASATYSPDATSPVSVERFEYDHTGAAMMSFGYTEDGAATSIAMRVDGTVTANWAAVAASMRPLAVGGSVPPSRRRF